ncbi:ATP-binding cassette domain-containing protein [Cytophaga hutchinsonii]|uniref:Possible ABC-type molybdenum transporter, ATP-binding protein n=1 Tax=Cytophaga hutchinsonii (strain ATCC 33406 / DSM 1761 / CIP 103989 / NBRC 15051 / NCIMB 9469 / D465) TaxID=269798 RepID=A0A6N4SWL7_CYTH3|nr:ATP-binding cassette domain-containing protein [Cytophaga hutchinsonii]ABG60868.1 possible ABC-type molybdenum transporter, ATP-binding protein [Cytophaga hutchinsonii ATCC 33406]SFX99998.1 molybdate transport system ATP-binding protein [Cytophaga hutchinsonii ATCC 33406]
MPSPIIHAQNLSLSIESENILNNISFSINTGECIVLTGASGSGKTSLAKILAGHWKASSGEIHFSSPDLKKTIVQQQHDFRYAFETKSYFGQRYDRNYSGNFPTVNDILLKEKSAATDLQRVVTQLNLSEKLQQPVIELSNGEGKRLQLALALLTKPDVLILDQPFIGLDTATRGELHQLLEKIKEQKITVILITTPDEIPACADQIFLMRAGTLCAQTKDAPGIIEEMQQQQNGSVNWEDLKEISVSAFPPFEVAVHMNHVNVSFGNKKILDDISWTVKRGEHWALLGHNGSGKSTLLSLINADNPQVYLNDVFLFDQKRGNGESIWEIKKKIGYVSPEMHNHVLRGSSYIQSQALAKNDYSLGGFSQDKTTCFEIVSSGVNDQVGSSTRLTAMQQKTVTYWMEALDVIHLKQRAFYKTSLGQQRLLLLARALVKNPPVLILDEPCQGLDKEQTQRFTSLVDTVCNHIEKTLIYVSHYASDMPSCIDHVLMLENGRVKEN